AARAYGSRRATRAIRTPARALSRRRRPAVATAGLLGGDHPEGLHRQLPAVPAPLLHQPRVLLVAPPVVPHLPLHVHHAVPAAARTAGAQRRRARGGAPAHALRRDRALRRRRARTPLALARLPEPVRRLGELPLVLAVLRRRLPDRPVPGRRRADRRRATPLRAHLRAGSPGDAAAVRLDGRAGRRS